MCVCLPPPSPWICRALEEFQRSGLNCSRGSCGLGANWPCVVSFIYLYFLSGKGKDAPSFQRAFLNIIILFSHHVHCSETSRELFVKVQVGFREQAGLSQTLCKQPAKDRIVRPGQEVPRRSPKPQLLRQRWKDDVMAGRHRGVMATPASSPRQPWSDRLQRRWAPRQ